MIKNIFSNQYLSIANCGRMSALPSLCINSGGSSSRHSSTSPSDMTKAEYIKFKENFIEKQKRLSLAKEKLDEIRENHRRHEEHIAAAAAGQPIIDDVLAGDLSTKRQQNCFEIYHPNVAESEIKMNCIRATIGDDNSTMIAADKIAESAIKEMENQQMMNSHNKLHGSDANGPPATLPSFDETIVNICLNVTTPSK